MDIVVDGLHIRYIDRGPADARATVLLLHGWGVDGSIYHLITDHLSDRFRMVVPDLPGFGGSQEPPAPWTLDDYADFVERVCRQTRTARGGGNGALQRRPGFSSSSCPRSASPLSIRQGGADRFGRGSNLGTDRGIISRYMPLRRQKSFSAYPVSAPCSPMPSKKRGNGLDRRIMPKPVL